MIYHCDIEADGLLDELTKIHCLSVRTNNETSTLVQREGDSFFEIQNFLYQVEGDTLVFHNGSGYDLPALVKLGIIDDYSVQPDWIQVHGTKINVQLIDTLALSRHWFPDLPGGHGLEPWSHRVNTYKPEITDWKNLSIEEYVSRCENDTISTEEVFKYLLDKLGITDISDLPFHVKLAQKTYDLMCRQERTGVCFDQEAAKKLVIHIDTEMERIRQEVEPKLPTRPLKKGELNLWTPPKLQFKKDGTPSAKCLEWFDSVDSFAALGAECIEGYRGVKDGIKVALPFHEPIIDSLPMELKDQGQIKDWLVGLGWKPLYWNVQKKNGKPVRDDRGQMIKTSPKFHENGQICPNLERLGNKTELVKPIITWLSLRNRRSVLINEDKGTGWLNHHRLKIDGRLPASSSGLTNTHREKHRTVANIPRSTSLLGKEFRSLFQAPEGMVLVGYDASSLEARVKGHYTYPFDNGEYADKLLDPDWDEHTENASVWLDKAMQDVSKNERQDIKPGTFALQYNCQPPTLARTLGVPLKQAEMWWNAYWEQNWALRSAIEETEQEFEKNHKKYITTIDGSKIVTRAKHSVFNAKCQSAGQKIMNLSLVFMDKWIKQRGIPAQRVVVYHDEGLFQTFPEYAELIGMLGVKSIIKAGEYFKMNVPLDGEWSQGQSWLECH